MHHREAEARGVLPIRKDIQRDYSLLFRLEWMQRVLDASYRQIRKGSGHMPASVAAKHIDTLLARARAAVNASADKAPPTFSSVRTTALEASHGSN
jgi:hypothetical protein